MLEKRLQQIKDDFAQLIVRFQIQLQLFFFVVIRWASIDNLVIKIIGLVTRLCKLVTFCYHGRVVDAWKEENMAL